ncbi:recombinase RecT [Agrobacterium tumefaciens]|uniref:recombinase RecT n=1 Tax=Agrobacterium tumefaciens TaxID=358 RepID=UPI001574431B|nr:recombinase RecT [Agrobacterium tumefaciens]NTA79923.1 recombinase RecT [Agrobacterium tumefaciens]
MNQLAQNTERQPTAVRERIEVIDAVPLLDTSRFEHMQRVATVMARSTLMPESLYMEGKKDNKTPLPYEKILSNCFLVVNQAVRWGLDPFAVAQCVSVVHGKLCYEGKLVAAVLQAKLGMNLHHHIIGSGEETRVYMSDRPFNEEANVGDKTGQLVNFLKPGIRVPGFRLFDGSVDEWKTNGANSPWSPKNFPRMLIYRGTRDWCRIYEPATMLGVYTDDEMVDMEDTTRSRAARDITPKPSLADRLAISREATEIAEEEREGFTATPTADQPHDALTGEILDNTDTDEPAPASSVDAGTQPAEGEVETPPAASPSNDPERDILIRFAAEMLPMSATAPTEAWKEVEKGWSEGEMKKLSDAGLEKAKSISTSLRAIAKGNTSLESAVEYYAEVLDCQPSEIGGAA